MVALEPFGPQLVGPQEHGDSAIREHRSRTVTLGEGDDDSVPLGLDRPAQLDALVGEQLRSEPPGGIGAALAEPTGNAAELRDPGGDVRLLAPAETEIRAGVSASRRDVALRPHDHVEHEIAEGDDPHVYDRRMARQDEPDDPRGRRARVRSFVLGGLVGASAVAAALRRARRRRARPVQTGLGAFESAPCYRELLERGAQGRPVAAQVARGEHDGADVDVGVADPERLADEQRARARSRGTPPA